MKKLTIEEKARRYDEAIKIAKSKIKNDKDHVLYEEDIIEMFPELKKKTDKEMIQKLIAVCHLYYGEGEDTEKDECLEWLEKQVKQKPIERIEFTSIPFGAFDSELIEEMITIPDGCVATIEGNRIHIKREYKTATEVIKEEKVDNSNKDKMSSWTLNDAQDGDVLISPFDKPFIYNGKFDTINVGAYCGLNIYNQFTIANEGYDWTENRNIRPATKKQVNALFNEMNLLGWIWNPETKELNRLDKK